MLNEFPTYPKEQRSAITLNGISPESMTLDYDCKHIRIKKFQQMLPRDYSGDVFCAGTLAKSPVFRFRPGQEIDVDNPYVFGKTRAVCLGSLTQQIKGLRVIGYFFAYIDE
ncbi:hypothetical protein [Edwardsiella tarda]|uniref:Uncharacterized protein n=1 Tax=Edwardsiella tarda TaxID=636 RepID=A0A2A7U6T6_EDWTA|nr:hypothetical protein [Edwardsiella tarda]PEH74122.1 hypothetical protein CRM76_02135 [Edwardsiella tarda]